MKLIKIGLLVLALALCAFAQLPTTCVYVTGAAPTQITMTVGTNVYYGLCINGVVFQVPTVATSATYPIIPPLVTNAVNGVTPHLLCHAQYSAAVDTLVVGTVTLTNGCTLPANAIIFNSFIYVSSAVVGSTSTMAFGYGSSHAALKAATAEASLTTGSFQQSAVVPQTASGFLHLATASAINVTIAGNPLTAGVVDIWVEYLASPV